jgi:hypothetical protein
MGVERFLLLLLLFFFLACMVDNGMMGLGWLGLPREVYKIEMNPQNEMENEKEIIPIIFASLSDYGI